MCSFMNAKSTFSNHTHIGAFYTTDEYIGERLKQNVLKLWSIVVFCTGWEPFFAWCAWKYYCLSGSTHCQTRVQKWKLHQRLQIVKKDVDDPFSHIGQTIQKIYHRDIRLGFSWVRGVLLSMCFRVIFILSTVFVNTNNGINRKT